MVAGLHGSVLWSPGISAPGASSEARSPFCHVGDQTPTQEVV